MTNNIIEPNFHIIMKSPYAIEKNRRKVIILSKKEKIITKTSLKGEIRGIIELKGGFYLSTKEADVGIYNMENLDIIQRLPLNPEISNIFKIKDENLDLISISSNLSYIILISIFQKKEKENNKSTFEYKEECRIKAHTKDINRIIQLSNGLIVSTSYVGFVIFWKKIKKENLISLEMISQINLVFLLIMFLNVVTQMN